MTSRERIKTYYRLTKPGIVYGNAIAAIAGYFFGAMGNPDMTVFAAMLVGICFVMASACVFNNVMDKGIDAKMARTQRRAVVTGEVRTVPALVYATILLALGTIVLWFGTNALTLAVALFGHFAYVILYGYAKRTTVHGTLVGTISGSTPPVIGYVAATGQLDIVALLLFLILVAWQMPHFYAIALFRKDDYAAAGIPVLPVVRGTKATRRQIILYVLLFVVMCVLLGIVGASSLFTTLVLVLLGSYWLYLCLQSPKKDEVVRWARGQFGWSLKVLLLLCVFLAVDPLFH